MYDFGVIDPFTSTESIFLKSPEKGMGLVRLFLAEITVIEIQAKFLSVHTVARGVITSNLSLSNMESRLDPTYFIRIHNSFIVSKNYIDRVAEYVVYMLYYKPKLNVGKTYRENLDDVLYAPTWRNK